MDGGLLMAHAGRIDSIVLQVLCDEPGPWVQAELEREFTGRRVEVGDAVRRLVARGLVLRMEGGFVVASASGRYAHAVEGGGE